MAVDYLIDDDGEVWSGPDYVLADRFRIRGHSDALTEFLTEKMGYIGVRFAAHKAIVKFDRSMVSTTALESLLFLLHENGLPPTSFRHDSSNTDSQVLLHRNSIVEYIGHCLISKDRAAQATCVDVAIEKSMFAKRWAASREIFTLVPEPQRRDKLWNTLFQGFFTLLKFDPSIDDYRVVSMGDSYLQFENSAICTRPGHTFRDYPDKTYGQWVADCMRAHRQRGVGPRVEQCAATFQLDGRGPRRMRYERLIVPLVGTDVMLAASQIL